MSGPNARIEMAELAVIEAARIYMALSLRADRIGGRTVVDDDYAAYEAAVHASLDALQELRDALSFHSRVRAR